MVLPLALALAVAVVVAAHGEHKPAPGENIQQYAVRHMASEHHIDSFDSKSFFQIHDLNRNGYWDRDEIEAIYGVHHVYSQKKSKDEQEHQQKAAIIVSTILEKMDRNKDGRVSMDEFEALGIDGLPNFAHLGAEGHHYDVESEFFLHHEEMYHNTPETQTDEAYNHPEDLEHFAEHEAIEAEEARRERKFQGLPEGNSEIQTNTPSTDSSVPSPADTRDQSTDQNHAPPPPQMPDHPRDDQKVFEAGVTKPKVSRPKPSEPAQKYAEAFKEGRDKEEWGSGREGYKRPKTPAEKMRRNVPYKYKFRRNWGDF